MGISKLIKIVCLSLICLTSCREIKRERYDYEHKEIVLKQWDLKQHPIHKVSLLQYEKGVNFSSKKQEYELDSVADGTKGHNAVFLQFSSLILTDKDYQLTINDSVTYKIKNIKTSYTITPHVPLSIDSAYNMIKSMNINGKEYIFDEPRVFTIPKEAYIIENK